MRRDRSLRLEPLEGRELLSRVGAAPAPVVATPVVLTGTLAVNMKAATSVQNDDGSTTTSIPVSGRLGLGDYGKFQGTWNETIDAMGDYQGPDWIQLKSTNPKGSFVIEFNNLNTGSPTPAGHGLAFYQHAQHLYDGTGLFARASESGSIELMEKKSNDTAQSLVLITANP